MRAWIAVIALAATGCEPAPGETRCTSTMVYGTAFTRCRTTPMPPPPQPEYVAPPPRSREPLAPAIEPAASRAVNPMRWWCVTFEGGRLGACYQTRGSCEKRRAAAIETDASTSYCDPQPTAACFDVAFAGLPDSEMCSPHMRACFEQRDYFIAKLEDASVRSQCRVLD
jgi:hypothetical protein